jgi:hypothetical protein
MSADRETLMGLAERCEQATGPDRELDCRVAAAVHPSMAGEFRVVGPPTFDEPRYFSGQEGMDWIGYDLLNNAPAYTASLDAAMALIPDGEGEWPFVTYKSMNPDNPKQTHQWSIWLSGTRMVKAKAATPALALTAASLRAIASKGTDHEG